MAFRAALDFLLLLLLLLLLLRFETRGEEPVLKNGSHAGNTGIDASTSCSSSPSGPAGTRNALYDETAILQILQRLIPINDTIPHTICQDYEDEEEPRRASDAPGG